MRESAEFILPGSAMPLAKPLYQCVVPFFHLGISLSEGKKRGLLVASRDRSRRNDRTLTIRLARAIAPRCAAELHQDTIAEFFANFVLTAQDVSRLAFEMTANGRSPADAAREWVDANSDLVDAMLGL